MSKRALILGFLLFGIVWPADLLKPTDGKDRKEILTIQGKRRLYYQVERKPLLYEINGPARLKIYSRTAASQKSGTYVGYGFAVQIDDREPLATQHKQKLTRSIKAPNRPDYRYSRSAVDFLTIPKGKHQVRFTRERRTAPVLLRVLDDDPKPVGKRIRLTPLEIAEPVTIKSGEKLLSYYQLSEEEPLYLNLPGPTTLELISRLAFEPWMGREQDYRIQVWDNGKLQGTYYLQAERSATSVVVDHDETVPGKWRTCSVPLGSGDHRIKVRMLDGDRKIFIRANRIQE